MRHLTLNVWALGVLVSLTPTITVRAKPAPADDPGSIVIVFKNGSRQTFRLADIARIEFTTAGATTSTMVPGRARFLGEWKVGDGTGGTFTITLKPDGKANKSLGSSEGTWIVVNGEAQISWQDGWHDAIRKAGGKYEKAAFSPGTSFSDQPSNVASAERKAEPN